MHRQTRQLIFALSALLLLGAQQIAFSHMIGHLGAAAAVAAQPADPPGDGATLGLSHLCAGCLAISALAAGALLPGRLPALAAAIGEQVDAARLPGLPVPILLSYAARAPPGAL